MSDNTRRLTTVKNISEKKQFWKEHAALQIESGLSRKAYCYKHQLNYDQFYYWLRKEKHTAPRLLPVKLQQTTEQPSVSPVTDRVLCTIKLRDGSILKIHDKSILPLILSTLTLS
jgi:hypothetical protein